MSPLKQPSTRNSQAIDSPPLARLRNVDFGGKKRVNAESIQEFIKVQRKMEEFDFDSGCTFNAAEMLL